MALPMSLSRKKESIWHKFVFFSARPIKWGGFIKLLTNGVVAILGERSEGRATAQHWVSPAIS